MDSPDDDMSWEATGSPVIIRKRNFDQVDSDDSEIVQRYPPSPFLYVDPGLQSMTYGPYVPPSHPDSIQTQQAVPQNSNNATHLPIAIINFLANFTASVVRVSYALAEVAWNKSSPIVIQTFDITAQIASDGAKRIKLRIQRAIRRNPTPRRTSDRLGHSSSSPLRSQTSILHSAREANYRRSRKTVRWADEVGAPQPPIETTTLIPSMPGAMPDESMPGAMPDESMSVLKPDESMSVPKPEESMSVPKPDVDVESNDINCEETVSTDVDESFASDFSDDSENSDDSEDSELETTSPDATDSDDDSDASIDSNDMVGLDEEDRNRFETAEKKLLRQQFEQEMERNRRILEHEMLYNPRYPICASMNRIESVSNKHLHQSASKRATPALAGTNSNIAVAEPALAAPVANQNSNAAAIGLAPTLRSESYDAGPAASLKLESSEASPPVLSLSDEDLSKTLVPSEDQGLSLDEDLVLSSPPLQAGTVTESSRSSSSSLEPRHEAQPSSDESLAASPSPEIPISLTPTSEDGHGVTISKGLGQTLKTATNKAHKARKTSPVTHQISKNIVRLDLSPRHSGRRRSWKEEQQKIENERLAAEQAKKEAKEAARARAKAEKEKAEADEKARKIAEEKALQTNLKTRRMPKERAIQPLSAAWEAKVDQAMRPGTNREAAKTVDGLVLHRRDFGFCLPQHGQDHPQGWLNDNMVLAYLQTIAWHANEAAGIKRGETKAAHAFDQNFYNKLKKDGPEGVARWTKRAKIAGTDLLKVRHVFIPINLNNNHWVLVYVSPVARTIEYFDSFHGSGRTTVGNVQNWLQMELKADYKEEEWTIKTNEGPMQTNGSDCGVFAVTVAKMIVLGADPMAFSAADIPTQRRRMIAELMNQGFTGELEPNIKF
ncbi:MAG: hypothetical protein Q9167_006275 [Letrouitia subvulpina]